MAFSPSPFGRSRSRAGSCIAAGVLLFAGIVLGDGSGDPASVSFTARQRGLWSLQSVAPVQPPAADQSGWGRTPIDSFIAERLARAGVTPAPAADRATLLRRASLDVIGLPPTPDEIRAFERDAAPDAFARVVDRLLASPRYGERWGRHWLDLARYAESEGFKADETRPNAWRYRDYVIRAFNADKPYDRFVQEQLAGDELWPEDPEALVATGFNRHYPDESNARNLMQRRQDILNDITDTTGAVFCGLTFACARCHDHKWDPITQADYYRFQAYFANTAAADELFLLTGSERQRYQARLKEWEGRTRTLREEMARIEQPHRDAILRDYIEKYPDNIQVALKKPAGERTSFEQQMVAKARLYLDPASHQYLAPTGACVGRMKKEEKARWTELRRKLDGFAALHPGPLPLATGVAEVAPVPPPTFVLKRGLWDAPLGEVQPGFLTVLSPDPSRPARGTDRRPGVDPGSLEPGASPGAGGSGRRTALARLLTNPGNPLTARVMVNRIWQHHFGQGLVGSPSDFGLKGEAPSHPELLDWLAGEFIRSGWSVKQLHRLILNSAVYQTASVPVRRPGPSRDPDNKLLAHFPRPRLEGETLRDAALFVAGRLNDEAGGPSVFPELPPGMETRGGWPVNSSSAARDRRSVYVFVRRNTRYPLFETFDMPDTHETCARRNVTTSPVQALALLNSSVTHDWARSFAGRVLAGAGADPDRQLDTAWSLAYGRVPDATERRLAREFLRTQSEVIAVRRTAGAPVSAPGNVPAGVTPESAASLVDLCHALLNSNEFVYRN